MSLHARAPHLDQIIATLAPQAFRALPEADRRALVAAHGSVEAARAAAFAALPEQVRIALIKGYGHAPDDCGPELPMAPARGPLRTFDLMQAYPDGEAGTVVKMAGFAGRKTAQLVDAFDRMRVQSARGGGDGFALTSSQIGMGRVYGGMVLDQAAGGVRCIDLSAEVRGGSREGFTDARLDMSRRIDALRARVGDGTALAVRRVRPSVRGTRRAISDRAIVDAVCVQDLTAGEVLRAHGWCEKGETRAALMAALAGALDRMIGGTKGARMQVWHAGGAA